MTSGAREHKAGRHDGQTDSHSTSTYNRSGRSGNPVNLGFSRHDDDGDHLAVGLNVGRGGLRAYYHRDEHGRRSYGRYDSRHRYAGRHYTRHHYGHDPHRFTYGFDHLYYPYGRLSYYDIYYYRFPYYSSSFVYVEQPTRTVYVESDLETRQLDERQLTSPGIDELGWTDESDYVKPQAEIPVNNPHLADAERAFHEGRYDAARGYVARAALNEPQNGFAQLTYGLVHFALGEYGPAAGAARRGLSLVPDVIDRPIDITRQYGSAGDLARHTESLKTYTDSHAGDADAWFLLGYIYFSSGHPDDAARVLDQAASLNPFDTHAAVLRDAAARLAPEP